MLLQLRAQMFIAFQLIMVIDPDITKNVKYLKSIVISMNYRIFSKIWMG